MLFPIAELPQRVLATRVRIQVPRSCRNGWCILLPNECEVLGLHRKIGKRSLVFGSTVFQTQREVHSVAQRLHGTWIPGSCRNVRCIQLPNECEVPGVAIILERLTF